MKREFRHVPRARRAKQPLRPSTKVLTEGSTQRFPWARLALLFFAVRRMCFRAPRQPSALRRRSGRAQVAEGESPDLIYSRINHPNAEMLEDQIVTSKKAPRPRSHSILAWPRS